MPNTERYSSSTNPDTSAGIGMRPARNSNTDIAMEGVAVTWLRRYSTRGKNLHGENHHIHIHTCAHMAPGHSGLKLQGAHSESCSASTCLLSHQPCLQTAHQIMLVTARGESLSCTHAQAHTYMHVRIHTHTHTHTHTHKHTHTHIHTHTDLGSAVQVARVGG